MKPYIALDIETTGINPETSQIIQIAAVYDPDGITPITQLPKFDIAITNKGEIKGEPFALSMHSDLFKRIASGGKGTTSTTDTADGHFGMWLLANGIATSKLTVAGKNAAGFDLPFLKMHGFKTERFSHRVLDVGPVYFPDFGYVPSLAEINKLTGRGEVQHDAYADCIDVIVALRAKLTK